MKILTLLFISLCAICINAQTQVQVDAANPQGAFTQVTGANGKPYSGTQNFLGFYGSIGITSVRTHDYYGAPDWYSIFQTWSANSDSVQSYKFSSSDSLIVPMANAGFSILFRLGSSWRGNNPLYTNDPPGTVRDSNGNITHTADSSDFLKFANVCKHIVMHYNDGWANGHHLNITRWEIWNEPSLSAQFWSGSARQFRQMFSTVAKVLKQYNPNLIIGGPGQEGMNTDPQFIDSLFRYCQGNGTALDFYSWHTYGGRIESVSPYEIVKKAQYFRSKLTQYGYGSIKMYCDEFNCGPSGTFSNTGKAAAFIASCFSYFTLNGVDENYLYRADQHPMGLLISSSMIEKIEASALRAWKVITSNTARLPSTGNDTLGFTSSASKSQDGKTIRVLVSNYPSSPRDVNLQILNLSVSGISSVTVVRKYFADSVRLATADSVIVSPSSVINYNFTAPKESGHLIEIKLNGTTGFAQQTQVPDKYELMQNYPNPFNPSTMINYSIPKQGMVTLKVYDMLGREVQTLVSEVKPAGSYTVELNAAELSSGPYFYKIQSGEYTNTKRMLLLK